MSSPNPYVIDADTLTGDLAPIRRAALSLGSNEGDRLDYLQAAIDSLAATPEIWPVAVSPVYETDPVGGPEQDRYLNAVVVIDTTLPARALMERGQAIEAAFGRVRGQRWAARTVDIDVLALGDQVHDDPDLTVPHPRIAERGFVLVPWAVVDPDFPVPGQGLVHDLAAAVNRSGVTRVEGAELRLPG